MSYFLFLRMLGVMLAVFVISTATHMSLGLALLLGVGLGLMAGASGN